MMLFSGNSLSTVLIWKGTSIALFSSSVVAGLVVVTLSIVGADVAVLTVLVIVMDDDDDVIEDDGPMRFSGMDVTSKFDISVVHISAMLVLVTVTVWCQADVVNSSAPLVWINGPNVPGCTPLPTWASSNSEVGLVTKVKSSSSITTVLLLPASVLSDVLCTVSFIIAEVTESLAGWLVTTNGMVVFGSMMKLLGVFIVTLGVVASTLVSVVRLVYPHVLYSVYETLSVVVLVNVEDGGFVELFKIFGIVGGWSLGGAMLVVLAVLQDLQQMRRNAGIMQYCWSIVILHNIERSVRHRAPITQQSEGIRLDKQSSTKAIIYA